MKKIYNIGGYEMTINTEYENIPKEDLEYFVDLPQIAQFQTLGFSEKQAIEIMYESANLTASIFDLTFHNLETIQKEKLIEAFKGQAA